MKFLALGTVLRSFSIYIGRIPSLITVAALLHAFKRNELLYNLSFAEEDN